eukprot:137197-Amorphochlora_amoeboformis.AAC.1
MPNNHTHIPDLQTRQTFIDRRKSLRVPQTDITSKFRGLAYVELVFSLPPIAAGRSPTLLSNGELPLERLRILKSRSIREKENGGRGKRKRVV